MSTYKCPVCFYICDLNLEVIGNFQARTNVVFHTGKTLYHLLMEISGDSHRNFWSNDKRPGSTVRGFSKPRRRRRRRRERQQTKGLMSKTMVLHVRFESSYISLPSSAKQQREMTKGLFIWRWGTPGR